MARAIDGDELLGIERLLDTDVIRKSKTASWLLDQVLHDIQAMPTLTQPNKALTLKQLREMNGQPVWVEETNHWALIDIETGGRWSGIPFVVWAENGANFCYNIKARNLQCYRMPTLAPPNEWVSVEKRLPEDEARQYIKDELDGIGYLYPCLLTYKSPNTERIHVVRFYYDIIQKWFVNNREELCEKGRCIAWMPLPAPYDRRPPEVSE